ncbi:hypothetical protein [Marinomonas fungiae]|uniref:hypothetical protein n=1 Tax=Marinomonas fungiae TaxID=1137284 RepID=UPI003A933369
MIHTLLVTLLIPLIMLFSLSVKAVDSTEHSLLKGGLLESVYEVPTAEVAPDIDHAIAFTSQSASCEPNRSKIIWVDESHPINNVSSWFCRGPPKI